MKKLVVFLSILVLGLQLLAVPANPKPAVHKQPDGEEIVLKTFGDEWFHFYETLDGYTVIKNKKGFYVYADLGMLGEFVPTEVVVHTPQNMTAEELSIRSKIGTHLRPSQAFMESIENLNPNSQKNYRPENAVKFNKDGKIIWKVIVLLIQYPDLMATESVQSFHDMMVQEGYTGGYGATGSFNDYYKEISYGAFEVEADVYGWYTASNGYLYYANDNGSSVAQELVAQAVDSAEIQDGVDFSLYDNDNNGTVDQVIIVHAGPGAEEGGNTQYIWSHKWNLSATGNRRSYDGVWIDPYIIQPEKQYNRHCGIGVFCHEFGHALGLPDLYDTDNSSEGIGNWGLMGAGSWLNSGRTPDHMTPWSKKELNWINPTTLTIDTLLTMSDVTDDPTQYFKIPIPGNSAQYFLLENRQKTGFNSYLPTSGLLMWHIDEAMSSNRNESRKLVDLEEADGRDDLDFNRNRGDAGDVYPTTGQNAFNELTYPSSIDNTGNPTFVSVNDIVEEDSMITATINLFGSANFSASQISGHAPLTVDFTNASVTRTPYTLSHWDFNNDGTEDSQDQHSQFTYDTPGRYSVKLTIDGAEYSYSMVKDNYIRVFDGNSALSVEAMDESMTLPAANAAPLTENFTIQFMMYPTAYGLETNTLEHVFDKGIIYGYLREGKTRLTPDSSFIVAIKDSANQTGYYYLNTGTIQMNEWQSITITVSDTVLIYVNGILAEGGSSRSFIGKLADNSSNDLVIGNDPSASKAFAGMIDEFRIWKKALTEEEITNTYNNELTGSMTGLYHYFKMNEGSGETITDQVTGNTATGTIMWEQGPSMGSVLGTGDGKQNLPISYRIEQNYPNPFNPTTTIPLYLGQSAQVKITVYNSLGQRVMTILNKQLQSGSHQISFDATNLATGIYFYDVQIRTAAGKMIQKIHKMMLLK